MDEVAHSTHFVQMILILVVALFGLSESTNNGAVSGTETYGDYRDFLYNIKNDGEYGIHQYEQKRYIKNENKIYDQNNGYSESVSANQGKKDGPVYNVIDNTKNKDGNGGKKRFENYDKKNLFGAYYGDDKFDEYDGPKDFIISDKSDKDDRSYDRDDRRLGSDRTEYDYVPKCDENQKDCKDGKDCYDKAKDRTEYDKCRDTYGNEDRYYDEEDRYTGNRYRYESDGDRYGYQKDCYDNSKNRADYDKCRQYYRRCSEYNRKDYKYSYNEQDWKNDRDCGYDEGNLVGLGRNDREDQLIRPCALDDRQCIRKYFARNSNCKPAYGPIPDPLYLRRNTAYLPFTNITLIFTRLRVTGLSSIQIKEFYINKDTRNLVIALDFRKLNETSPKIYIRYKRTAKESIVLSDYGGAEYNSGTFTAVIPKIPHLRLDLAEVHADIDDVAPRFFIGPRAASSTDPDVITGFARANSNIPVATQEFFLLQAQLLTAIYIQENICDFGLKLISI